MKREEIAKFSEEFGKEVETIVLTQGKLYRHLICDGKLWFTIFEVMIENKKMSALVAHEEAFRAVGAKRKGSAVLVIGHSNASVLSDVYDILITFKSIQFLAA